MDLREDRMGLIARHGVSLVLDVGANAGQYASALRASGYSGEILSFEPIPDAYRRLAEAAVADALWQTRNVALGDRRSHLTLHVSANSYSSSFLQLTNRCVEAAPDAA